VTDLRAITPMHVAAYIEQHPGAQQPLKQHLAAIKMPFDYLVISQIVQLSIVIDAAETVIIPVLVATVLMPYLAPSAVVQQLRAEHAASASVASLN
jgi:hypothetical protein